MEQNEIKNSNGINTETLEVGESIKKSVAEYFFANFSWFDQEKTNKSEKWSVSANKSFDRIWFSNQKKQFDLLIFDFMEKFETPIFAPALFNTRKFLLSFLKGKAVQSVTEEFKEITNGLENIWFNKYRGLFANFFKKTIMQTKAPEYFFYKYYYQFLSSFRTMGILLFTDVIIPNIVLSNAPFSIAEQYDVTSINYYDNIKKSIVVFAEIVEEIYQKSMDQYQSEVLTKGSNWKIDYSHPEFDLISMIIPNSKVDWDEWIATYRNRLLVNN